MTLIVEKDLTPYEGERVLDWDYPVFRHYLYVFDSEDGKYVGAVWKNSLQERKSTVEQMIMDIEATLNIKVTFVKNCEIYKRKLKDSMV